MPSDQHEKLYSILLDVQKQIGSVNAETSRQSQMLVDLNTKVGIQNGRVTATEKTVADLKEWRKYIFGGFAVISALSGYLIYSFKKDIIEKTSDEVISTLEEKYNLEIK